MEKTDWYKDAVIYQIYPRSFQDSNGDGIGDIPGITSRLDYLKSLGVNCVWLSPVYDSPQDDNGYDIADYYNIWPKFGTLEDFKTMLKGMHDRGIRLIMDLVVNHTSDESMWFKESRKSKDNPYRDYYIWKKGKGKNPPNNWTGFFSGKAWEYDEATEEWYLHLFTKKQPDLNWENPKVREEVKKLMAYWLDMGVDGFRCDVINLISKDQGFKNNKDLLLNGKKYFVNGPRLHEYLKEINRDVLSKYDCMTVGETCFTTLKDAHEIAGPSQDELSMIFNFDHTDTDDYFGVKWLMKKFTLKNLKKAFDKWQYGNTDGWNSLFLENHDQRRCVGRFGTSEDVYRVESAKMLGTMYFFLKGTPFIYEGQEIGMTNNHFTSLDQYKDTETHSVYETMQHLPLSKKYIHKAISDRSRDNARTPMQWDDSEYAGFSECEPWIEVNSNKSSINVKHELEEKDSIFHYYQKLIEIRKAEPLAKEGIYKDLLPKHPSLYVYTRSSEKEMLLCISNFTEKDVSYSMPKEYQAKEKHLLISNYPEKEEDEKMLLQPYETRLYKIKR